MTEFAVGILARRAKPPQAASCRPARGERASAFGPGPFSPALGPCLSCRSGQVTRSLPHALTRVSCRLAAWPLDGPTTDERSKGGLSAPLSTPALAHRHINSPQSAHSLLLPSPLSQQLILPASSSHRRLISIFTSAFTSVPLHSLEYPTS